jgi:hypothetical protein
MAPLGAGRTVGVRNDLEGGTMPARIRTGRVGDWIDVALPGGGAPRHGQIVEVLGAEEHKHYRVRWTDGHESIFFPSEGAHIRKAEREADD